MQKYEDIKTKVFTTWLYHIVLLYIVVITPLLNLAVAKWT